MPYKDGDAAESKLGKGLASPVRMPVFKSQLYNVVAAALSKLISGLQFPTNTIILPPNRIV